MLAKCLGLPDGIEGVLICLKIQGLKAGGGQRFDENGDSCVTLLYSNPNCLSFLLGRYIGQNIERKFRGSSAMIGPFRVALPFRGG